MPKLARLDFRIDASGKLYKKTNRRRIDKVEKNGICSTRAIPTAQISSGRIKVEAFQLLGKRPPRLASVSRSGLCRAVDEETRFRVPSISARLVSPCQASGSGAGSHRPARSLITDPVPDMPPRLFPNPLRRDATGGTG